MGKAKDINGQTFGRLLVIERKGTNARRTALWLCKCQCGNEIITMGKSLRNGDTLSCGCYSRDRHTVHGKSKTLTCESWRAMHNRCHRTQDVNYKYYGGRGITICERWKENLLNFITDMGERPSKEYSLDRIDVDGNYSCGHCDECKSNGWVANCKWSTAKEQRANQRETKPKKTMIYNGQEMKIVDVIKMTGISGQILYGKARRQREKISNGA